VAKIIQDRDLRTFFFHQWSSSPASALEGFVSCCLWNSILRILHLRTEKNHRATLSLFNYILVLLYVSLPSVGDLRGVVGEKEADEVIYFLDIVPLSSTSSLVSTSRVRGGCQELLSNVLLDKIGIVFCQLRKLLLPLLCVKLSSLCPSPGFFRELSDIAAAIKLGTASPTSLLNNVIRS
jgi:hypothetical protein